MRRILLAVPVILGLTLVSILSGLLQTRPPSAALAAPGLVLRYVAPGGEDAGNDCTVQADPCASIQHAVDEAAAGDQILLAAGVYTESVTITKALTISGAGAASTFLDGGNQNRVLHNSSSLTLSDITIRNGYVDYIDKGAGIYNTGAMTLTDVDITGNYAGDAGGGIFSVGTVFGLRVNITDNTASQGGAITNRGTATFFDSSLSFNTATNLATGQPGGGAIDNYLTGSLLISNTLVLSNTSLYNAGLGIFNEGSLEIYNSEISWNTGSGFNSIGTIYSKGPLTIFGSHILNNASERSSGIINSGSWLTVTRSVIAFNAAIEENGAGIVAASGHTSISNSAIISNTFTGKGGGVLQTYGWLTIVNTEISGNQAGGIYADSVRAVLTNTSVINNGEYGLGGDVYTMTNSIIAGSAGDNCDGTTILSHGGNLEDDDTCGFTLAGDYENTDPLIGAFITTGPVWFHDFQVGSPAADHGNPLRCPPGDIRGLVRPVDGDLDGSAVCDIGALEYLPPLVHILGPTWGAIDTPYSFTGFSSYLGLTPPITYTWESTDHPPLIHAGGLSDTVTFTWPTPGTSWITVTVRDAESVIATDTHQIDLGHLLFLPALFKPHVPNAGLWDWDTTPGYFFVTEDNAYVDNFSIYVFGVGSCGVVRIYTTSLIPIVDNAFAFNGSDIYIGSGIFDTAETAHGMVELDNLYISQCGASVTVPPTPWTGTNPLDGPAAAPGFTTPVGDGGGIEFMVEVLDE